MPLHARDALAFVVHDLVHMEHFWRADTRDEQCGFFRCLAGLHPPPLSPRTHRIQHTAQLCDPVRLGHIPCRGNPRAFFAALGGDEQLWQELEYLISDMNCYSVHLLGYLKAKWALSFIRTCRHADGACATSEASQQDSDFQALWRIFLDAIGMPRDSTCWTAACRLCTVPYDSCVRVCAC